MKILIITDAWKPQVNGVVRTYEHIIEVLDPNEAHQILVISPSDFKWTIPLPGYSEIKLVIAPNNKLKALIEEFEPESIHVATEGPLGKAGRKYCIKNKLSFTTAYHTQFPDYVAKRLSKYIPPLYNPIKSLMQNSIKRFHSESKAILITTNSMREELLSLGYKTPMYELTRGAPLELFYPGKCNIFEKLTKPIALYVGRVAIEKNLEDFLSMEWEGSKVVVGDGPSLNYLQSKYPDAYFVGKKTGKTLAEHYRAADVFVFPSKTDTFGIVLLEALASGVPIAAYNVTGPKDIVTESFLGSLEDNLSIAAQKATQTHPEQSQQRHEFIKSNYSWEKAANQFLDVQLKVPVKE
jgi:glycosyltransferase involved in cell wall biosynthesis